MSLGLKTSEAKQTNAFQSPHIPRPNKFFDSWRRTVCVWKCIRYGRYDLYDACAARVIYNRHNRACVSYDICVSYDVASFYNDCVSYPLKRGWSRAHPKVLFQCFLPPSAETVSVKRLDCCGNHPRFCTSPCHSRGEEIYNKYRYAWSSISIYHENLRIATPPGGDWITCERPTSARDVESFINY